MLYTLLVVIFTGVVFSSFDSSLKVVFLLVSFLSINESTYQTRKVFVISPQKLFPFLRKSDFRILYFQIS